MSDEFDISKLFQQAHKLQEQFKQMQEDAASKTVEAESGGGMVRVVADGSMRIRSIDIDPSLLASNDRAMLQDLVTVAVNDGLRKAHEMVAQELGKLSPFGGLNIPGLSNLFGGGR